MCCYVLHFDINCEGPSVSKSPSPTTSETTVADIIEHNLRKNLLQCSHHNHRSRQPVFSDPLSVVQLCPCHHLRRLFLPDPISKPINLNRDQYHENQMPQRHRDRNCHVRHLTDFNLHHDDLPGAESDRKVKCNDHHRPRSLHRASLTREWQRHRRPNPLWQRLPSLPADGC